MNIIDPLNMHYVCANSQAKPLATDGATTPALVVTNTVWRELEYLTKVVFKDMEYSVFLTLTRPFMVKPLWLATGFYMPKQEVSPVTVDIDLADVRKFVAEGNWHHKDLCHWHSHNRMWARFSSTDITEQEDRSELAYLDNYRFYVVINDNNHYSCDCVTYDPFFMRTPCLPIYTTGVGEGFDNKLTKERKDELVAMATEQCTCNDEVPDIDADDEASYMWYNAPDKEESSWHDSDLDRELQQMEDTHHGNHGLVIDDPDADDND